MIGNRYWYMKSFVKALLTILLWPYLLTRKETNIAIIKTGAEGCNQLIWVRFSYVSLPKKSSAIDKQHQQSKHDHQSKQPELRIDFLTQAY